MLSSASMTHEAQNKTETVEKKKDRIAALERQLGTQWQRLLKEQRELADSQAGFTVQEKKEAAAKGEISQLSAEVLQLEKTLLDLKALKSRKGDSFSLVPYRGRLGDSRQPIYIECASAGLIVHPGPTMLEFDPRLAAQSGSDAGMEQIITEYERRLRQVIQERAGQLDREKARDPRAPHIAPPTNAHAYVLFLVRPEGILSYHIAQDALRGYAIDYGYELVDREWVFDFSSEEIAAQQEWHKDGPALPRPQIGGSRSSWTPGRGSYPSAAGSNANFQGTMLAGPPGTELSGPPGSGGLIGPPNTGLAGPPGSGPYGPPGTGPSRVAGNRFLRIAWHGTNERRTRWTEWDRLFGNSSVATSGPNSRRKWGWSRNRLLGDPWNWIGRHSGIRRFSRQRHAGLPRDWLTWQPRQWSGRHSRRGRLGAGRIHVRRRRKLRRSGGTRYRYSPNRIPVRNVGILLFRLAARNCHTWAANLPGRLWLRFDGDGEFVKLRRRQFQ